MADTIRSIIEALGYTGVALLMYLEMVIPIIPSEVIMPFAGFTAGAGSLSLIGIIAAGTIGSLLGALTIYAAAHVIKDEYVYAIARRYGSWVGLTPENIERAEKVFDRHSRSSVFVGRLIPGVRSAVSLPAGIRKMPLMLFIVCTLPGVALWTALLAYLGFVLGERYEEVGGVIGILSNVIIIGIVVLVLFQIVRHVVQLRKKTRVK